MTWNKVKEVLPEHKQEVLIRETSGVQLATFNAEQKAFAMKNGGIIPLRGQPLEWMKLN